MTLPLLNDEHPLNIVTIVVTLLMLVIETVWLNLKQLLNKLETFVRVDDVGSVNGFSPSSMTLPLLNDEHPRNN